jgi:predicted nucleic acid-binding protein
MTIAAYHRGYVLDASVAAKWFVRQGEADRRLALSIRQRHVAGQCRLILPEFGLLEIANAIRYSPRAKEADGAAALELLHDLNLEVHSLSWDLLRKANAIAWGYKIAVYDAVYVALAELLGFPLLTADEALLKKMKGHSIVLRLRDLAVEKPR